ncbi:MAG: hypothetical protein ACTSQJ_18390, partial [Promethearchaeota archaeon]
MNFKLKFVEVKSRFKELWQEKIFRYAILVHSIYFILSIILFFTFYYNQNDFLVYYKVGEVFVKDYINLYNQNNYLWNFRYFPLSALFFVPFYFLGYDLGFIIFHICNLFLNILICVVLYKILILIKREDHEEDD